jgi:hypothetical protein
MTRDKTSDQKVTQFSKALSKRNVFARTGSGEWGSASKEAGGDIYETVCVCVFITAAPIT